MLWNLLASREPVYLATTAEEKEAIYRFRYEVYATEKKWTFGGIDHERQVVTEPDDDSPHARHIYTGSLDQLKGAARLMVWGPGQVQQDYFDDFEMGLFPNIAELTTAEIGRFIVRPGFRGKQVLPTMASFTFDLLAGTEGVDLTFCYCRPTLLKYYRRLGARPYGGRPVPLGRGGLFLPLVSVMSDYDYFRSVGAITAPNIKKAFGRGKRPVLDQAPFAHLFAADNDRLKVAGEQVLDELEERLSSWDEAPGWMGSLPPKVMTLLADSGCIFDVDPGGRIVAEGMAERELYLLLEGTAEVLGPTGRLAILGAGELLGEMAFFREAGVRTATVQALEPCRVMSIRFKFLEELKKKDPDAAFAVLFQLGRILSDRLHERSQAFGSAVEAQVLAES